MPRRFINCSACRGCHTGRGGKYCAFTSPSPNPPKQAAGAAMMFSDPDAPDRGTEAYEAYLSEKIVEEEALLKTLKDRSRVTAMEEQLSRLRIQTNTFFGRSASFSASPGDGHSSGTETGVASRLLTAATQGAPATLQTPGTGVSEGATYIQRSKEEKDVLSKLKALTHLAEPKQIEKVTYRDFICSMTSVLKLIVDLDISPKMYVAHMNFIASKAKLNIYATDALIRYEAALTDRVIDGRYSDWVAADPECVALHLGADATYAVRQGGNRWARQSPGTVGGGRDFSDWPKEICWLYNNTTCYFPRCKKAHICAKCKRTGHAMKDCKSSDEPAQTNPPEALSTKSTKEARKA